MANCSFVRRARGGYEFGLIEIKESGTKHERREYNIRGTAPTMDEALSANAMAQAGLASNGKIYTEYKGLM
jgi:hypothetical protein